MFGLNHRSVGALAELQVEDGRAGQCCYQEKTNKQTNKQTMLLPGENRRNHELCHKTTSSLFPLLKNDQCGHYSNVEIPFPLKIHHFPDVESKMFTRS